MRLGIRFAAICVLVSALMLSAYAAAGAGSRRNSPVAPDISVSETVRASALADAKAGDVRIVGRVYMAGVGRVLVRVTSSLGATATAPVTVSNGAFQCAYPKDFPGAPALDPCMLFIDATTDEAFDTSRPGHFQAEAALIVYDSRERRLPDLPSAFTNDLLDSQGRTDQQCAEWPTIRTLVNLYMRSQGARAAGVGRPNFDLANPEDLRWFKNNLTLCDFDYRDRAWSRPLGHRPRRTFWQSVWNTWFNWTNDNPLDSNPANKSPSNYMPYAFANDFSDNLIMYLMRLRGETALDDNLLTMCREGAENMMAMQHREPSNFALVDWRGKQETYTAGAFRYGMFKNGVYMTEKTGWFYNPKFLDYVRGGVLNGRAVWALGEALRYDPQGPLAPRLKESIALAVKFCLQDALPLKYAQTTKAGNVYWYDAGEHGYLLIGMLAACEVDPQFVVLRPEGRPAEALKDACVSALNALVDLEKPEHQWSVYTNKDPMAIIALMDGATVLRDHPDAQRWRETAARVGDAWLAAKVDPKEFPGQLVHFGLRIAPDRMTFNWRHLSPACPDRNVIHFYLTGHWIHALSRLYAVTGEERYRQRAEAMISYLCGDNPWHARLFNETGGVYNWVEDTDDDGVEDWLRQDMYPESTCFCQIGIMHLLRTLAGVGSTSVTVP